jgi:ABC-2 type transport system ATP-binding protein
VISTRLLAGRTLVSAIGDTSPGAGFEPAAATLEDVYFAAIAGQLAPSASALEAA